MIGLWIGCCIMVRCFHLALTFHVKKPVCGFYQLVRIAIPSKYSVPNSHTGFYWFHIRIYRDNFRIIEPSPYSEWWNVVILRGPKNECYPRCQCLINSEVGGYFSFPICYPGKWPQAPLWAPLGVRFRVLVADVLGYLFFKIAQLPPYSINPGGLWTDSG